MTLFIYNCVKLEMLSCYNTLKCSQQSFSMSDNLACQFRKYSGRKLISGTRSNRHQNTMSYDNFHYIGRLWTWTVSNNITRHKNTINNMCANIIFRVLLWLCSVIYDSSWSDKLLKTFFCNFNWLAPGKC